MITEGEIPKASLLDVSKKTHSQIMSIMGSSTTSASINHTLTSKDDSRATLLRQGSQEK